MAVHAAQWEAFRTEAARHDEQLEAKLTQLEHLAHGGDATSYAQFERLHRDVQGGLAALQRVVQSMADLPPTDHAVVRQAKRWEDVCLEKRSAVTRIASEAKRRRERAELLTNVHTEINVYDESAELRRLASEQDSAKHTLRRTQEILEQADINKAKLAEQRLTFASIGNKAVGIIETVPVVNAVLRKIDAKRRREAIVVALVIVLCLILIVVFW